MVVVVVAAAVTAFAGDDDGGDGGGGGLVDLDAVAEDTVCSVEFCMFLPA